MHNAMSLPSELTEQGQRNHALAATWTTGDDHNGLRVARSGGLSGVQDKVECQLLLG